MIEYSEMSHYHSFISYFGDDITFQTFDDKVKNKRLIKQLHGSLKKHFKTLWNLNKNGAGIFFSVSSLSLVFQFAQVVCQGWQVQGRPLKMPLVR